MRRAQTRLLTGILAASFLLAGCGAIQGVMLFPTSPTLVILGDSVSAGQYVSGHSATYPYLLAADLHARLTVFAYPGHTTAQTRGMYTGELFPTYAVIELGTNDYNRSIPPATFAANYHSVVASIATSTKLVCLSIWDPSNMSDAGWSSPLGIPLPANHVGATPAAYNAIIARSCRGTYLSLQSFYDTPVYHGSGAPGPLYHPNAAGDAAIAHLIYTAFQSSVS